MADLGNTRIFGDLTVSNKLRAYDLAKLDNTPVVWEDRTITAGSGLTGGGSLGGNLTLSHADTSSQISASNSGRTYIQSITLDTYGHITSISSATNTDTHVGTVTSIAMTVPTGLSITGSPITSSGTLELSLTSGYSIPTTAKQGQWDTAYSLRHSSGSDNQTISAGNGMNFTSSSGDVSIVLGTPTTLSASTTNAVSSTGHTHSITGFSLDSHTHTFSQLTSKPTTVSGFGITDAMTTSHSANGITSGLISNWNTAYTNTHTSGSDNQTISAGNGMDFTSSSGNVSIVLGTPTALTGTTTDAVSSASHTHSVSLKHSDLGSIGASDHHTRYSNAEAVAAVNAQTSMSIDISGSSASCTGNANSATNITGGLIGSIPYQTAVNKTALLPKGTAGYVLTMGASNIPSWVENSGGTISAGAGMNFTSSNKDVSIEMGTPSTISIGTSNSASGITHTHALTLPSTMTPSSHTHGNISNGGAIGTTSGLMIKTTTSGVLTALAAGTTSNYLRGDGTWATPPNNNTTYTAGSGIDLTGTVFSHNDTSSQASLTALTGADVVSDIDVDEYGHITLLDTRTLTLANLGYTGATNANYFTYSHPSDGGGSIATDLTGATVISKIVVNAAGHVTETKTRTLTLANLGYTGATNANYFTYSHPTGDGNLHVPATSTTNNNKFLMAGSTAGSLSWGTPTNTTYSAGTGLSLTETSFSVKYGTTAGTSAQGNDSRLSDARTPTAHTHTFASLTSKPTTVSGFGITDAMTTSHEANGITSGLINNWNTAYTDTNTATNSNTASKIVKRDVSGNFSAGTITASLSGNATSANKVNKALSLKFDAGTEVATEGTNLYTFDGSSTKTINIKGGTNVSIAKASGEITISATDTKYTSASFTHSGLTGTHNLTTDLAPVWGNITSKPNTVSGYAITDAMTTSHPANSFTSTEVTNLRNGKLDDGTTPWTNASNLSTGTIASSLLPPLAITSTYVVATEVAQIALVAEEGDVAVRTDLKRSYIHNGGTAGTIADWTELQTPTDSVLSVNGKTGTVSLSASDVGALASNHDASGVTTTKISNWDAAHTHAGTTHYAEPGIFSGGGTPTLATGVTGAEIIALIGASASHSHPYLSNSTTSTQSGYFGNIYLKDDTTPSHYLIITDAEDLTANRTLSLDVDNDNRTLRISGDAVISGTNTGDQTVGDAKLTLAAGTGVTLSDTPSFTANATTDKTITITNNSPNVTTNISITHNATTVSVNSSDGTDGTINGATATTAGVVTNGAQTWAGVKTFNSAPVSANGYTTGSASMVYNPITKSIDFNFA